MRIETRKLLDRAFSGTGLIAIAIMALALVFILAPIVARGSKAFFFKGTIEHRRVMLEQFNHGKAATFNKELVLANEARAPIFRMLEEYAQNTQQMTASLEQQIDQKKAARKAAKNEVKVLKKAAVLDEAAIDALEQKADRLKEEADQLKEQLDSIDEARTEPYQQVVDGIKVLLGPLPNEDKPVLVRQCYGQTRWDRSLVKLNDILYFEEWIYPEGGGFGEMVRTARVDQFKGTALEPLFGYLESHLEEIMRPNSDVLLALYYGRLQGRTLFRWNLAGGAGDDLSDAGGYAVCDSHGRDCGNLFV